MGKQKFEELFVRHEGNPILTVKHWPEPFKLEAVFNAAATKINDEIVLFVRVRNRKGGSHFTLARSKDGETNWEIGPDPTLRAEEDFDEGWPGLEDARIVWLKEIQEYVIAYVSFSNNIPGISLAKTENFSTFERVERPSIPGNKDASLFPQQVEDYFVLIHRPNVEGSTDQIWLSFSKDLRFWGKHKSLFSTRSRSWDEAAIGLGPPPIWTSQGWLVIYHGVQDIARRPVYRVGLVLLDLKSLEVKNRSEEWVFGPKKDYEGGTHGIVFPCGCVLEEETGKIRLYYGANDESVALATAKLDNILDYLVKCPAQ